MFILGENAHASSILAQAGTQWNLFLFTGTAPTSVDNVPFNISNMQEIYANAVAGLRLLGVNSTMYGQELIAFENVAQLFALKMHGARTTNGIAGIQLLPQNITSNIAGLEKPAGYVNGLENNPLANATASTHLLANNWIEYDFGTDVSVNRVLFGNNSNTARNATSMAIEYFDGNAWQIAANNIAIKTYVAAGIESNFAPITAQRWRIRFLNDTGTVVSNTLIYNFLRFFGAEVPVDVMSKENLDFTWAMLVPAQPTVASIYENLFAQRVPAFIVSAGGPVDGATALLNRKRATINDIISCVSLKVKTAVTDEV
jgi:hypothetical protein